MLAGNHRNRIGTRMPANSILSATPNRSRVLKGLFASRPRQMGIAHRAINSEVNNQSTVKLAFWYREVCSTYFAPKYLIIINIVRRPKIVHFLFYYYLIDNSI